MARTSPRSKGRNGGRRTLRPSVPPVGTGRAACDAMPLPARLEAGR